MGKGDGNAVEPHPYMDDLSAWVFDQSKAISYRWLSNELSVSANDAKRMLFEFVQKNGAAKPLTVWYLVAGRSNSTGAHEIKVVAQDSLEEAKAALSPVTLCVVLLCLGGGAAPTKHSQSLIRKQVQTINNTPGKL